MTEHDGLTAEQEAVASSPTYCAYCNAEYRVDDDIALIQAHIYQCPEHPLPKALARAEAAEARVDQLMQAIIWMSGSDDFGPGKPAHDHWVEIRDTLLFPPTTEAVTEVEGS